MYLVQEMRARIRHFIQHPRRLSPLLQDAPNWNMLASSFDTVADTEMAISTYEAVPDPVDMGMSYLSIYGILQCLYVQQDAVESLVRAFEPNTKPTYRIESEPEHPCANSEKSGSGRAGADEDHEEAGGCRDGTPQNIQRRKARRSLSRDVGLLLRKSVRRNGQPFEPAWAVGRNAPQHDCG